MKKCLVLLSCLLFMGSSLFGQQVSVAGTVTDATDGMSLPGVTIQVQGTTLGTVTDINGRYQINVAPDATLIFSFIGMVTQQVPVGDRRVIDVQLVPDVSALDEVIVVAYGTARRSSFTGSASTITAERIEERPITSISRAIEGTAPGIQVSSGSGAPGSGQAIRIRGFGSVNASNAPLYVVDGVPYDHSINNLNPNDIESISVLKDAAATALYGNRAANGVIMITTKRGSSDRTTFQVRMTQGFSTRAVQEFDRLGPEQWTELAWEALRNQLHYSQGHDLEAANQLASDRLINEINYNPWGVPDNQMVGTDGRLNPNARMLYSNDNLDWEQAVMRLGDRKDANMSYSGGTDRSDYFVSLGYLNDQGYLIKTDFQRFTGRINVNSQVTDWLTTGFNVAGTRVSGNNDRAGGSSSFVNPFRATRGMGPIFPIYQVDPATGQYFVDDDGNKQFDLGNHIELGLPFRPGGADPGRHVVAETLWNIDEWNRANLGARTYGEVSFLDNFTFRVNVGLDVNSYLAWGVDNRIVGDGAPDGRGRRTNTTTTSVNFQQLLRYNNTFGLHSLDLLFGHESTSWNYQYTYGFRQGIVLDGNIHLVNFTTTNSLNSYEHNYRGEGYFTSFNYGYDQKYFLSGSFRRDGSSRFYRDSRWGNFYSVGAAWRLDREEFVRDLPWINILMLRASYGQVGNDSGIGYYAWQSLYSLGRNNAAEPGFQQSSLPAFDLVWESNNTTSIALEFGVFNRLRGTAEFFHRISSNLLFSVPLPPSTGVLSRQENIGEMYNRGIELRVAYDVLAETEFQWTIDVNATRFTNEVTKLPQEEIISGSKKLMEGRGIYDFWIRQWYGVDPADGLGLYYADTGEGFNPEAAHVRLINGDTLTTSPTAALWGYSGSAIPDVLGGITNIFRYRNLEMSVLLTYSIGGWVNESAYSGLMNYGTWGSAMHEDLLNRWQQPGDVTDVPRMNPAEVSNYPTFSTRWMVDASYLNIRSVNLSYTFPSNIAQRLGTQRLRVYAAAENLALWTALPGMNVQQNFAGTVSNVYSVAGTITFGVNVTF